MKWIISHQSALEFWRRTPAKYTSAGKKLRTMKPCPEPLDVEELQNEDLTKLTRPLHVLVGGGNARKARRSLYCHVSAGELPSGSFIRMESGLVVSSPELCFLQMAAELSFTDLVKLGYEFCGGYRLGRKNEEGRGFRDDLPLTTAARLSSYVSMAAGLKGCRNARRASEFIADGSASPMETILTMLLILPYKFGGYGFPKPRLNYCIDVPSRADERIVNSPVLTTISQAGIRTTKLKDASADKSKHYCDLYWPDRKVDVEYDSDAYHTGADRIAKDAIRRNTLAGAGVTVITVSRKQIVETSRLRELAKLLSKLLGKRLKYHETEFNIRQARLLNQLLPGAQADGLNNRLSHLL